MQKILGEENYSVYNLGKCGADTRMEFENLSKFPEKPDLMFLQYYQNDIEGVGKDHLKVKINSFKTFQGVIAPLKLLLKNSYFLNYVYFKMPKKSYSNYGELIKKAFNHSGAIKDHYSDLYKFKKFAENRDINFSILYFPTLYEPVEKSMYIYDILKKFTDENNVDLIDASVCTHKFEKDDRVVNKSDPHPSAEVSICVAEMLDNYMKNL